ncbi:MAG: hypothetical protein QXQ60_06465 [Thermofilum sp.]
MDAGTVATIAGLLLLAHYIYVVFRVRNRLSSRDELQKMGFSVGALILLGFIIAIDVYEFAARMGGNPAWTDYRLTVRVGEAMKRAAEDAIRRMLDWARGLAVASAISTVAFWVAAVLSGGVALLAAWAVNIGIDMLLALVRATLMAAQAVWATGQFYTIIGELAPVFRAFAPLGVALMVAPRTRRAGAGIFALAVLMGYAAPYALNSAAATRIEGLEPPQPFNSTMMIPAQLVALQTVPLENGTTVAALPPGALLLLSANGTRMRPAGVITPLPARFTVAGIAVTSAYLPLEPFEVELPPEQLANLNCSEGAPKVCPRSGAVIEPARLENCKWIGYPLVNFTLRGIFVAGDERGWGWVEPVKGRFYVDLRLRKPYVPWYNYTFPSLDSRIVIPLAPGWGEVERFNCTVNGVNTTCIRVLVQLRGSIGTVVWMRSGWGRIRVNNTEMRVPANVSARSEPAPGLRWSGLDAALAFNASAALLNASMPPGTVQIAFTEVNGTKLADTVAVLNYTETYRLGPPPVKVFNSPLRWPKPGSAKLITLEAVYAGEIVEPAVAVAELQAYGAPADDSLTLIVYDPLFDVTKHREVLNELAKNWLHIYPFLTLAAAYFAAAVFACDALSGLLGGPSITMRFVPSRWRRVYWGVAVGAIVSGIAALMRGAGLTAPGRTFLGKYDHVLSVRRNELALLRQKFPLARLERALGERAARLASRVADLARLERDIIAKKLWDAAQRAAEAGLRRAAIYKAMLRIVDAQTPYTITAAAARFAWHLFEHRQSRLATAVLAAAADTLRREAYRRHGALAPIYAPRMLKAAAALDAARILLTPEALAWRLTARIALGTAYRDVVLGGQVVAAMVALKAARVAAEAAKDQQLLQRLNEAEAALARRAMKPGEALRIAKEAWLLHKGEVEAWLAQVKANAERLIERAVKIEKREDLITVLKEVKKLEAALEGALPHAPEELRPRIEEALRALRAADRALFAALGALEALGEAEKKVRTITVMPPVKPHEKPAAPVAGWEKWLAEVGLPLNQAYEIGAKLNELPGGLLESALHLLKMKEVDREKAVAAIKAALRDVSDPALRGLLDAVEGRAPDARAVMWGAEYVRGYASIAPERIVELLARGRGREAREAAELAVRELLGEKVHVPPHLARHFTEMQVRLRWGEELAAALEKIGLPPARWVSTLQPDVAIAYALAEAAKVGKAEELLKILGRRYLTPTVQGAVDAVRGAKPEDLLERLEKRDGYAVGFAIASPERFAAAVAQSLAERLGIKEHPTAQLGALAAVREVVHFERVGRVTEHAEIARVHAAKLLLEAMYGVDERLARLIWQLDAARAALQDAAAKGDVDGMAEALARGFEAVLNLREVRGELRQQLPPERYEALKAEMRAWRDAFASTVFAAEGFAKFMESLAELIPPEKPAPAAARDLAEGKPGLEELVEAVRRGEVEKLRRMDMWDAMRLSPEEAARVYKYVEDPFARGVLKEKIGLEPEGPEERLGYLHARADKLEVPQAARDAVREAVEMIASGEVRVDEKALEVWRAKAGDDDRALGYYIAAAAWFGLDPAQVAREVMAARAERASREVEEAVEARRLEAWLESLAARMAGADEKVRGALSNLNLPELWRTLQAGQSVALQQVREALERAAGEALLEAQRELAGALAAYRELLAVAPREMREALMERIRYVSELLSAIEEALGG